ncbi:MAG: hypothetical protein U0800_10530 [Isosphaeraceae bacterium]
MNGSRVFLLAVLMPASIVGCGATTPHAPMPEPSQARAALESALGGWVERGEAQSEIDGARIELSDRRHAEGGRPSAFEVLGTIRVDWARGFVVRLTWPDEAEPETTTYAVAGIDPIWVMRKDDIDLLMHWEHPMDPANPSEAPPQ